MDGSAYGYGGVLSLTPATSSLLPLVTCSRLPAPLDSSPRVALAADEAACLAALSWRVSWKPRPWADCYINPRFCSDHRTRELEFRVSALMRPRSNYPGGEKLLVDEFWTDQSIVFSGEVENRLLEVTEFAVGHAI